jgi:hypothetical protein
MKLSQFSSLIFFNPTENWGDIEQVQWFHIHHLYLIRSYMSKDPLSNWQMIIHCSYEQAGHSIDSFHYKGMATDFHFNTKIALVTQYMHLEKAITALGLYDFLGIGVYPEWRPHPGGFHIDSRGSRTRWIRKDGIYKYGDSQKIIYGLS